MKLKISRNDLIRRSIKILDIGYITAIYFILGVILAVIFDRSVGNFNLKEEEKKPLWQSILEIIIYLWVLGIVIYIVRNVVPWIPFPLDNMYGFDHLKVKEVTSAAIFSFAFLYFQKNYQDKIKYIMKQVTTKYE
jgi:hypothetical protein